MGKYELVKTIANLNDCSQKFAHKALMMVIEGIQEELVSGNDVKLIGFGKFEIRVRKERKGHNPKNGELVVIPAISHVKFVPGEVLNNAVRERNPVDIEAEERAADKAAAKAAQKRKEEIL